MKRVTISVIEMEIQYVLKDTEMCPVIALNVFHHRDAVSHTYLLCVL